jgi:hypothetical protein
MPTHKPAAARKTAVKKLLKNKETVLTTLARKLGHVAGTLTHAAQGLAVALPAGRPGSASKIKKSTHRKKTAAASGGASRIRTRIPRKKAGSSSVARSPRKRAVKN